MAAAPARPCLPARPPGPPASRPADQPPGQAAARPPRDRSRPATARAGHRSCGEPGTALPTTAATNSTDLTTHPLTEAAHHGTQPGRVQRRVLDPLEAPGRTLVRHPRPLRHRYLHPPRSPGLPHRKAPPGPWPLHTEAPGESGHPEPRTANKLHAR